MLYGVCLLEHKTYFKQGVKAKKHRKNASKHYEKIARMPCMVCGARPIQIHHITGAGMGLKANDNETIPLCELHHLSGGYGVAVHSGVKAWEKNFGTQKDMLEIING